MVQWNAVLGKGKVVFIKRFKLILCFLTVHLCSVLVNKQLDAQFFSYIFIPTLYMFGAPLCSLSGESIVLIRHLMYVTLCRGTVNCAGLDGTSKPAQFTVTYIE
jgi:hypothetical protein